MISRLNSARIIGNKGLIKRKSGKESKLTKPWLYTTTYRLRTMIFVLIQASRALSAVTNTTVEGIHAKEEFPPLGGPQSRGRKNWSSWLWVPKVRNNFGGLCPFDLLTPLSLCSLSAISLSYLRSSPLPRGKSWCYCLAEAGNFPVCAGCALCWFFRKFSCAGFLFPTPISLGPWAMVAEAW